MASGTAILDTGTTLVIGPVAAVKAIAGSLDAECWFLDHVLGTFLQASCTTTSLRYQYFFALLPCTPSDAPGLTFAFGPDAGDRFTLDGQDYVLPASECDGDEYIQACDGTCLPVADFGEYLGDGECDDGTLGLFFNCPALGCDNGDCDAVSPSSKHTVSCKGRCAWA